MNIKKNLYVRLLKNRVIKSILEDDFYLVKMDGSNKLVKKRGHCIKKLTA